MPKPKKKKPLPAAESMMESGEKEPVEVDPGEGSAARPSPEVEPPAPPPPSPGGLAVQEAKRLYDEAIMKSGWLDELAKRAKDKERLAERLCDAKYKRAESKQKRKPKNPYGRCTRMYEALIEELQAKVESLWYAEKAARGNADALACHAGVLKLENAHLNRQLRRCS